jgi:hypothetical protein
LAVATAGPRPAADAWLVSERPDFWVASAGGGALLVLMGLVLLWHGDRELDQADLLLSELHLGATYDAIVRRRLWRRMPLDVLAVPLAIVAATYALVLNGWPLLVTTTILYVGAWHRGRQNLGIARHYSGASGGRPPPGTGGCSGRPSICRCSRRSPTTRVPRQPTRARPSTA